MNLMWLLRASRWARHPPSLRKVLLFGGIIALCLGLAGFEYLFGWPDWLQVNQGTRRLPKF